VGDLGDEHGETGRERRTAADHPAAHVTDAAQRLVASQPRIGPVVGGESRITSVVHRCKQNHPAVREP
jgi:hypothetical protein